MNKPPFRKTILLVEDTKDHEDLTILALRRHNILNQVIVAHDGEEAVQGLYGAGIGGKVLADDPPALILLDLKLPKIGGLLSGSQSAYRYLPDSVSRFPDQAKLAAMMREAGFRNVAFENLTGGVAALHLGLPRQH